MRLRRFSLCHSCLLFDEKCYKLSRGAGCGFHVNWFMRAMEHVLEYMVKWFKAISKLDFSRAGYVGHMVRDEVKFFKWVRNKRNETFRK